MKRESISDWWKEGGEELNETAGEKWWKGRLGPNENRCDGSITNSKDWNALWEGKNKGINELVNERDSHKEKCNKNKMRLYVKQKIEYSEKNMQN